MEGGAAGGPVIDWPAAAAELVKGPSWSREAAEAAAGAVYACADAPRPPAIWCRTPLHLAIACSAIQAATMAAIRPLRWPQERLTLPAAGRVERAMEVTARLLTSIAVAVASFPPDGETWPVPPDLQEALERSGFPCGAERPRGSVGVGLREVVSGGSLHGTSFAIANVGLVSGQEAWRPGSRLLEAYGQLARAASMAVLCPEACLLVPPPDVFRLAEDGELHDLSGPALAWRHDDPGLPQVEIYGNRGCVWNGRLIDTMHPSAAVDDGRGRWFILRRHGLAALASATAGAVVAAGGGGSSRWRLRLYRPSRDGVRPILLMEAADAGGAWLAATWPAPWTAMVERLDPNGRLVARAAAIHADTQRWLP